MGGEKPVYLIQQLDREQKVSELSRMLSGIQDSDTGKAHAEELTELSTTYKKG